MVSILRNKKHAATLFLLFFLGFLIFCITPGNSAFINPRLLIFLSGAVFFSRAVSKTAAETRRIRAWPFLLSVLGSLAFLEVCGIPYWPSLGHSVEGLCITLSTALLALFIWNYPLNSGMLIMGLSAFEFVLFLSVAYSLHTRMPADRSTDLLGSVFENRNFLAYFAAILLPPQLILRQCARSIRVRRALAVNVFMAVYFIVLVRSRTSWAMLLLVLVLFSVLPHIMKSERGTYSKARTAAWLAFFSAIVCVMSFPLPVQWNGPAPYMRSMVSFLHPQHWSGRHFLWRGALKGIHDHFFFGVGPHASHLFFRGLLDTPYLQGISLEDDRVHVVLNDYLQAFLELGAFGGLLFTAFAFGAPAALVMRNLRASSHVSPLRASFVISSLLGAVAALADAPFNRYAGLSWIVVFLALASRPRRRAFAISPGRLKLFARCVQAPIVAVVVLEGSSIVVQWRTKPFVQPLRVAAGNLLWPWQSGRAAEAVGALFDHGYDRFAESLLAWRVKTQPGFNETRLAIAVSKERRADSRAAVMQAFKDALQSWIACPEELFDEYRQYAFLNGRDFSIDEILKEKEGFCAHALQTADERVAWAKAQGTLELHAGLPVFCADWEGGRMLPYTIAKQPAGNFAVTPFLPRAVRDGTGTLDLLSPRTLDESTVLFAGKDPSDRRFDIFAYDVGTRSLSNLTESRKVSDNGNVCVSNDGALISWRSDGGQMIGRFRRGQSLVRAKASAQPFERCAFADANTLVGLSDSSASPELWRCNVDEREGRCERVELSSVFENVIELERSDAQGLVITGRRKGEKYIRPYAANLEDGSLAALPGTAGVEGDVLEYRHGLMRISDKARYFLNSGSREQILYRFAASQDGVFGIVADERSTRGIASLSEEGWKPVSNPYRSAPTLQAENKIEEFTVKSTDGSKQYQSFYFGNGGERGVVVWWHGGPHENVSPRYNPYYHLINHLGYGVLAVNYPGSTGHGAHFESETNSKDLDECTAAIFGFLKERNVDTIVSWSVSAGIRLQRSILDRGLPVDGLVEQVGNDRGSIDHEARRRGIPVYTIRGERDPGYDGFAADYVYPGGHDIERFEHFERLSYGLKGFLRSISPRK